MNKKGTGIITQVNRNYGIITTNSFKANNEIFPFEISKEMIIEKGNRKVFQFSREVDFELKSTDGLRRKGRMLEAINLVGRSKNILEVILPQNQSYLETVRDKFSKFKFITPSNIETDEELYEWLKTINFQPRMLDYLIDGIFISEPIMRVTIPEYEGLSDDIVLDPQLIVSLDHVDKTFRTRLLTWIIGIEDAYKSFISRVSSNEIGQKIAENTILAWKEKDGKGKRQFTKSRNSRRFRKVSNNFDYVGTGSVSIEDLMEELDLNDLIYFIKLWHKKSHNIFFSPWLEVMVKNINLVEELSVLRNASAHGKPVIPNFMDPDYNPNWDLEFDNTDNRTKIENWILYEPLKNQWLKQDFKEEHISSILQTIFGNPYRKSWVSLNYIYLKIIPYISEHHYEYFIADAQRFLSYETNPKTINDQLSYVNLLDLRLSDMGPTTLEMFTEIPAPYKEIANEAIHVWKIFD